MDFNADLQALAVTDHAQANRVQSFMDKAGEYYGPGLTMEEYVQMYAEDVINQGASNPFYLNAMISPLHYTADPLSMMTFVETHAPSLIEQLPVFLKDNIAQDQIRLQARQPFLLEHLDIRPEDRLKSLRHLGLVGNAAVRLLCEDLNQVREDKLDPERKGILSRIYNVFNQEQKDRLNTIFGPDEPYLDPRHIARLLQMHAAGGAGGLSQIYYTPTVRSKPESGFAALFGCVYALNNAHKLDLAKWLEPKPEVIETILSEFLVESEATHYTARGVLAKNFAEETYPLAGRVFRDLVMTAQLLIASGNDSDKVLAGLEARGLVLDDLLGDPDGIGRSITRNLKITTLAPFRDLWERYGVDVSDYHGNRAYLDYLDDEDEHIVGRYVGEFGLSGMVSVLSQGRLEMSFPEMMPSYHISLGTPASELGRFMAVVGQEIDDGVALTRKRIDPILRNSEFLPHLSQERLLVLLNEVMAGEADKNVNYGEIFLSSYEKLGGIWVNYLTEENYEALMKSAMASDRQAFVNAFVHARRPSSAILSKLKGSVLDSCMAQDLGL